MNIQMPRVKRAWVVHHNDDASTLCVLECFDLYYNVQHRSREHGVRLFELLDGQHTVDEIVELMQHDFPGLTEKGVRQALVRLHERDMLEEAAVAPPPTLSDDELTRYSRQIAYFSDFEPDGSRRFERQQALKNARVTVLGLGGVGSWAITALAAAGVGRIRGVDGDCVEMSNLHRQILYTDADVGTSKAEAAARRVGQINPHVDFEPIVCRVDSNETASRLVRDSDLVLCLIDEPLIITRRWVNTACNALGIPMMIGGGMEAGPIMVPGETGCFFCVENYVRDQLDNYDNLIDRHRMTDEGWVPAMGTVTAIVGSYIAYEAVKFLSGYATPATLGRMLRINAHTLASTLVDLPIHDHCQACA